MELIEASNDFPFCRRRARFGALHSCSVGLGISRLSRVAAVSKELEDDPVWTFLSFTHDLTSIAQEAAKQPVAQQERIGPVFFPVTIEERMARAHPFGRRGAWPIRHWIDGTQPFAGSTQRLAVPRSSWSHCCWPCCWLAPGGAVGLLVPEARLSGWRGFRRSRRSAAAAR